MSLIINEGPEYDRECETCGENFHYNEYEIINNHIFCLQCLSIYKTIKISTA